MKNTLKSVFHSPRFVVGFVIFMAILLTTLIYPFFVTRDPLQGLGKGFLAPGTYVSVYDANTAGTYRVELPEAAANRMESSVPMEDRVTILEFLTAKGVDVSHLTTSNDDVAELVSLWKENYDEADVKKSKYSGFTTQAKRKALARLDKRLSGDQSLAKMTVTLGDGEDATTTKIADTDYVKVDEVSNSITLPLGTDNFGRDTLTELVKATAVSLLIGLIAGTVATLLGLIVGLLAVGFNFFHQHSSFLSKGETVDMDALLDEGKDFPVGEFVHVEAPFILDQFASEKSTINGVTSGEDTYYYVILNSRTAIAVKAASVDDIAVLDQGADDTYAYLNDELDMFDDIPIEGKLVKMTDQELIQYFDEFTEDYGFNDADSTIKAEHYIIDMTAARGENVLFYIIIPLVVLVVVIVIISRVRKAKKKKAALAAAEMPPMQ